MKLSGSKVQLRDFTEADLDLFRKWNSGHHKWMEFDAPYYARLNSNQLENRIEQLRLQVDSDNIVKVRSKLVIADKDQPNTFLGTVGWYWQSKETNWISIGIAIYDEKDWHKGYGYEAMGLWIKYLFNALPDIVRLDLRTWSGNNRMMRLAEKLGFKEEARFRKARIVNGNYYDSMGYGILREEWKKLHPEGFNQ